MTFDPYKINSSAASKQDASREADLLRAVFLTPSGKELIAKWKQRLATTHPWQPGMPEDVCRDLAGRRAVYVDIINICEKEK